MKYGVTFNQNGQVIPPGLHIPQNLANYPYVPHPLQLAGNTPLPVLGITHDAGPARSSNLIAKLNRK